MNLSKRERYVAIGAGAVLGLLLLDRVILTPVLDRRADLATRIEARRDEKARNQRLFTSARRANATWNELSSGTLRQNASDAEGQVLRGVNEWAQDAGLTLSSVKPERAEKERGFEKITLRATGTGTFEQVARFLNQVETARVPARLEDVQIASRREGADDLSLTVAISTIYLPPDPAPAGGGGGAAPPPAPGGRS